MKRHLSNLRYLVAVALLAGASACDSASDITAPVERPSIEAPQFLFEVGSDEDVIGPEGGILHVGDNYVLVMPNAVSQPTYFRAEFTGNGEFGIGISLNAWTDDFDGSDEVELFHNKILINLSYDGTDAEDLHRSQQRQLYVASGTEHLAGGVNVGQKRVWGWTDHFSDFVIARED